MKRPVTDKHGHTFEKTEMEQFQINHRGCPIQPNNRVIYFDNLAVKNCIESWQKIITDYNRDRQSYELRQEKMQEEINVLKKEKKQLERKNQDLKEDCRGAEAREHFFNQAVITAFQDMSKAQDEKDQAQNQLLSSAAEVVGGVVAGGIAVATTGPVAVVVGTAIGTGAVLHGFWNGLDANNKINEADTKLNNYKQQLQSTLTAYRSFSLKDWNGFWEFMHPS